MRGTEFAELGAFVAIAERRSFAKAAIHLRIARSTLSQNLRSLEERLGVRLLNRTTRSVSLTEAGERLLNRVRPALSELHAAGEELKEAQRGPVGQLRLVVQPPVASLIIGPVLGRFLAEHPGIRLDVSVVKMPADIVSEGFDAGIRFGEQVERDMIAVCVMPEVRFVVVASPKYLASHPVPKSPRDLQNHNCVRNRLPNGAIFGWEFVRGRRSIQAAVDGNLILDDVDLAIRVALDGVGLVYMLYDYAAPHVEKRRLIPVLESWSPRLSGFFLYYPNRRQMTAPLRALVEFLKAESKRRGIDPSAKPRTSAYPNHRLVGKARR